METVLLHKSAFLCVTPFFRLALFGFINAFILSHSAHFRPFSAAFPEIFRNDGPAGSVTIVPVVFPLIAGAGTLTTTLSLRAECHLSNLILAISLNMLLVYLVLRNAYLVERILGKSGVYVLRKFFGIILLAMSVRLFISNLSMLLNSFSR